MQFSLHYFFPFSVQCSMVPPSGFSRYTCKSYFLYYPFELSLTACTSCALSFGFFLSYATKDSFIYSLQYGYGSLEENTYRLYLLCMAHITWLHQSSINTLITWCHYKHQSINTFITWFITSTAWVILIIKDILKHIWWDGNLFEYFFWQYMKIRSGRMWMDGCGFDLKVGELPVSICRWVGMLVVCRYVPSSK